MLFITSLFNGKFCETKARVRLEEHNNETNVAHLQI
jgi:hypothetical protein